MLIIYWKSDGEIHQVATGYETMEEFYGYRFKEYSLIFDAIYLENYDDYFFNRYIDFMVVDKQLTLKNNSNLINLLNLNRI